MRCMLTSYTSSAYALGNLVGVLRRLGARTPLQRLCLVRTLTDAQPFIIVLVYAHTMVV